MKRKSTYKLIFLPVLFILLGSCQEVIEIDLNSASPALVGEGYMERDSTCYLELHYTRDYFQLEAAQPEGGARVSISDGAGNSEQLIHEGSGIYRGENLRGMEEGEYSLEIEVDGQSYQGSSLLMEKPLIYKLGLEDFPFGNPQAIEDFPKMMNISFGKVSEQAIYLMLKLKLNGESLDEPFALATDEYSPSEDTLRYTTMVYPPPVEGDTLELEVYAIDKEAFYYYYQVSENIMRGAMSSTPYNPPSNLGDDILGYFMARSRADSTFVF